MRCSQEVPRLAHPPELVQTIALHLDYTIEGEKSYTKKLTIILNIWGKHHLGVILVDDS